MRTNRKEIEEIFRTNQLGCNGHVMPTIDEWNKIGSHINELTAQVEELKAFLKRVAEADVETFHFNTQDGDTDCFEYTYIDVIEDANELLTRIGEENGQQIQTKPKG